MKTLKAFRILAICWIVATLFMLAYWGHHILSCQPPCSNHWIEVTFFVATLIVAIRGAFGSHRAILVLLAPAIVLLLYCVAEIVVCIMADELSFRFLYQPVGGTVLGIGTICTVAIVKRKEKTDRDRDAPYRAPLPHH